MLQRKARLVKEEAEDKELEEEIKNFKSRKRPAKRKPNEEIKPNKRIRLDGEEAFQKDGQAEVPSQDNENIQEAGADDANPPEREVGKVLAGREKLTRLRERMEREKKRIIDYLDRKKVRKEDLFLENMRKLWMEPVTEKKTPEIFVPEGWTDWWNLVGRQVTQTQKRKTVSKAGSKGYLDRFQPDQLLLGWRGWWNRMQAEAKKDSKLKKKEKENISTRMKSIKTLFYRSSGPKENSGGKAVVKVIQNTPSSSTTVGKLSIFSPKRKLSIHLIIHSMSEQTQKS